MTDTSTLQSALQYGAEGRIEDWVHEFLRGAGHNPFLSYIMSLEKRYFTPPVLVRLETFRRNCGPEEGMKYPTKQAGFEFIVQNMMAAMTFGWDMPPLIIGYEKEAFDLSDGNHRLEALKRLHLPYYFVIFWASTQEDYEILLAFIEAESVAENRQQA